MSKIFVQSNPKMNMYNKEFEIRDNSNKSLVGFKVNSLVVKEYFGKAIKNGLKYWVCQCESCQNTNVFATSHIRHSYQTPFCKICNPKTKRIDDTPTIIQSDPNLNMFGVRFRVIDRSKSSDITNKKIRSLTAVRYFGSIKNRGPFWLYRCDCGKFIIKSKTLTDEHESKRKKDCGCKVGTKYGKDRKNYRGHEEISGMEWNKIKARAKKDGREFSLTIAYGWSLFLKQNKKCALSGVDIKFGKHARDWINKTASLDRIDSSKGYTEDNVQWVHKDVNFMKMNLDENKFLNHCRNIAINNKKQKQFWSKVKNAIDVAERTMERK